MRRYLCRFCSWRGTTRSSCRRWDGSIPGDRTGDSVPPPGGRTDLERSSGSRPLGPRRTRRSWGRTSRTTRSRRFHSDYGADDGGNHDRLHPIKGDRSRAAEWRRRFSCAATRTHASLKGGGSRKSEMEGAKTKHFRQTEVWRGTSPPLLAPPAPLWFLSRIQPCSEKPASSFDAASHPNEKPKKITVNDGVAGHTDGLVASLHAPPL